MTSTSPAGQIEKQQHHRENGGWQDVAVGLDDGVLDEAVADQASVDEDVNRVAIQFLDFGLGDETVHPEFAEGWRFLFSVGCVLRLFAGGGARATRTFFFAAPGRRLRQADAFERLHRGYRDQLVENFFAEDLVDALAVARNRRGDQHGVRGRVQFEMLVGMSQGVVRHQRCDVRKFGGFSLEKFLSRRDIKEEVADRDRRPGRQACFFHFEDLAAVDFDHGPEASSGARVSNRRRDTEAIEGKASPRKPSVATLSKSAAFLIFEVAWRSKASRASSRTMPQPLSVIWMSFLPPAST